MSTAIRRGVFCLEGEWTDKLTDRASMRPLLQLVEDVHGLKFERRDVATRAEAKFYLDRWAQSGYAKTYPVAILAFHGQRGLLELKNEDLTLEEIGEILKGRCKGRYIHFDSCNVLDVKRAEIEAFRRQTGAHIVSGFRKNIGWIDSAAFTLHILDELSYGRPIPGSLMKISGRNSEAVKRLGFRAIWGRGQIGFPQQ